MMMRRILSWIVLSTAMIVSYPWLTSAQTTQPASVEKDASWLQQFVQSITDGSVSGVGLSLQQFGNNQPQTTSALMASAAGRSPMVVLVYPGVPQTLAADIAGALKDQPISDSLKQIFTPRAATDQKHADAVAARWVENALKPSATEIVGVVLFLPGDVDSADHPADRVAAPAAPSIMLIAANANTGGDPHIRRVIFGDPRGH